MLFGWMIVLEVSWDGVGFICFLVADLGEVFFWTDDEYGPDDNVLTAAKHLYAFNRLSYSSPEPPTSLLRILKAKHYFMKGSSRRCRQRIHQMEHWGPISGIAPF